MCILKPCYPVARAGFRSELLTEVNMEITVFRDMMPWSSAKLHGVTSYKTVIFVYLFLYLANLERLSRRWEGNIKKDPKEKGYSDRDWTTLVQDRLQWRASVNTAMKLWVQWKARNFLISWETFSFRRKIMVQLVTYVVHCKWWIVISLFKFE
jgi:hypothetical protein